MTEADKFEEALKDHIINDANSFSNINEKLDRILEQTTKHNGRLTKLERFMWTMGGIGIVTIAIVVPLFINLFR